MNSNIMKNKAGNFARKSLAGALLLGALTVAPTNIFASRYAMGQWRTFEEYCRANPSDSQCSQTIASYSGSLGSGGRDSGQGGFGSGGKEISSGVLSSGNREGTMGSGIGCFFNQVVTFFDDYVL
jgi:hypothetical protein